MYSCALWGREENGVDGDLTVGPTPDDLEAAQLRKIRHILTKARVRRGHRILEFGSGWGGLAIEVEFSLLSAGVGHGANHSFSGCAYFWL